MNLREFCRLPNFPIAVLTTYNIDPLFFERVVLLDLVSGGAIRIIVLADAEQCVPAIAQARGQLMALGRRYRVIPVRLRGSFHPKICVRLGREGAAVACGSHNLTRSGWLGCRSDEISGGNREATIVWRVLPGTAQAVEFQANAELIAELPESSRDRDELRHALAAPWTENAPKEPAAPGRAWWGLFGSRESLASTLERRWAGRTFERLRIVAGSTDRQAAMIRWAARVFGISKAAIEIDLSCCSFEPEQLAELPVQLRIKPYDGQPRTHLKMALFESGDRCAAVVGSANCSGSAWLRTVAEGGNIESAVVFDECTPVDFAHLFRSNQGETAPWHDIVFAPPPAEPPRLTTASRLRQLQLHRSAGTFTAILSPSPAPSARVFAVIQSSRLLMLPGNTDGLWRGPQPDVIDGLDTLFGHIEIEQEASTEITNAMWVDDVDRLNQVTGREYRFDALRRLSATGASGEYKRLLQDLQLLSQTLLSNPAEFPDGVKEGRREEKKQTGDEPPKPVTASDLLHSLDQLSPANSTTHLMSASTGSISLTGIMRILFTEDAAGTDIDPTAAEHQKSNEEREREDEEQASNGKPADPEETGPAESQRKRLIGQLNQFVAQLAAPTFAAVCSARQLQQAAAYPLAVAQFASRGPWLGEAEHGKIADLVNRVFEILFHRTYEETDPQTGMSKRWLPLVEEVRARYAVEGRAADFDRIVGDGTLWLVLMSSLALLREQPERHFARNLALRDVAQHHFLCASAIPEELAPLARRLWDTSRRDTISTANRLVEAFEAVESHLQERFESYKPKSAVSARSGDWLWNPGVGFAQLLVLNDDQTGKIHVRKRAETLKCVLLSRYVNLRLVTEREPQFAELVNRCLIE